MIQGISLENELAVLWKWIYFDRSTAADQPRRYISKKSLRMIYLCQGLSDPTMVSDLR